MKLRLPSLLLASVTALSLVLSGCGATGTTQQTPTAPAPAATGTPAATPGATTLKVVAVIPDKVGVNPFHQVLLQGLDKAKAELGVETKVVESKDWNQIEENLRAVAADGKYDLIITSGFESAEPLKKVAPEFPKQKFAIVDVAVDAPNVRSLVFKEHEAAFLLGASMGLVTKSNTVAMVGPQEIPFFQRWTKGIEQGLKQVNPGAKLLISWSGSFTDVAKAKEQALDHFSKGADVIAAVAGGGNMGVFEAAKEKNFLTSGQDTNQSVIDPAHVFISQVKRVDVVAFDTIKSLKDGKWTAGTAVFGLKENGVGLSHLVDTSAARHKVLTDDVMKKLEDLQKKIISGEIVVPDPLAAK